VVAIIICQRIGEQIDDGGKRTAHQHAAADALQCARRHQRFHAVGVTAQRRRHAEDHDRPQHERPAAELVAQAADHRHGDDRGQQVRGGNPGVEIEAMQLGHDGWQSGADDRLVQRHQDGDAAQAQHGQQGVPVREPLAARMGRFLFGCQSRPQTGASAVSG
jgi:hypothetical protein